MVSSSDYGYYVWQKRRHGQCRNRGRQKFDILNSALEDSGAIILTITPTIALMEDQERELK